MAQRRLLPRPAGLRFLQIREDLLSLCDGNHCGAVLLSEFEFLAMLALGPDEPLPDVVLLQGVTIERLTNSIMGLYGERSIRSTLALLTKKNFIQVIAQEGRPNDYSFCLGTLCDALETPSKIPDTPDKRQGTPAKTPGSSLEESLQTLQTSSDIHAREEESTTDSPDITAEDIHHSELPPNSETSPPAWESGDGPAPLHERNLIKAIERVAKAFKLPLRLPQQTKQRLKSTDEGKRQAGQEAWEEWRALVYAQIAAYAADPSIGTLSQALGRLRTATRVPATRSGAVTATGPPPPAGACQKLVTGIARESKLSFQGHIPAWKWALLEAIWFKDRDEFIERARKHFASCVSFDMSGNGALEAFIDSEKANNRPRPRNEITPQEFAEFMEENG